MKKSFAYIDEHNQHGRYHCKAELVEQHGCTHYKADGGSKKRCFYNGYFWECFSEPARNEADHE